MGGITDIFKSVLLDAGYRGTTPTFSVTHAGLMQAATSLTSITSSGSTLTKTSHGLSVNDVFVFTSLSGGAGLSLVSAGGIYYVLSVPTANTFTLGLRAGGSAITPSTALTAGTGNRVFEISGGSPAYARKSIAFAASAAGVSDDSTNGVDFDVPACTIDYGALFSASTAGNLCELVAVTQTVIAAQSVYRLTNATATMSST